jgi:hypothetical protein
MTMVTAPTAPRLVLREQVFASPGVICVSGLHELEARLPRQVMNALEAIGRQMETEIYKPILLARGVKQLKEQFTRGFHRYSALYISMNALLWSQMDVADITAIWAPIVVRLKRDMDGRGAEAIGEEAAGDLLVGLATVKLISLSQAGSELPDLQELQSWYILYWLAISCVCCYLIDREGNLQNVTVLASWSRYYATRIYQCAKTLGVVKVPVAKGPIPEPTDEDRLLSEAGLEDLAAHLALKDGK